MLTMACEERERENKEMAVSYISGFLCHYILDSTMHPYIYDVAGYDPYVPNSNEVNGAHTQLENLLDTWLIQYYKGKKSLKVRKAAHCGAVNFAGNQFSGSFFLRQCQWDVLQRLAEQIRDDRNFYPACADLLSDYLRFVP